MSQKVQKIDILNICFYIFWFCDIFVVLLIYNLTEKYLKMSRSNECYDYLFKYIVVGDVGKY